MTVHAARRPIRFSLPWMLIAVSMALLMVGCVSTKDRYEKAQELTQEERYAEAARYYVRVLRDDPDWPHARDELAAVGQRGVDRLLEEAERAAARGQYPSAVATLDALDALRANTESVGVPLTVPADYGVFRGETVRAAADQVIDEGRRAEEAGDWRAAIDAYERARQYVEHTERLSMLDAAQARASLRWAEDDMGHGHFRAAHERAAFVYDLVGTEHRLAREAEALQQTAIERGTRLVAFLPVGRTRGPTGALPRFFRSELNAVLQYDYWSHPPLFIAPVDPVETRRALRRTRNRQLVLSDTDAADAGRRLGADFVVVGELTRFERIEDDVEEAVRDARVRVRENAGRENAARGATGSSAVWRDTSYVVQTFDLALEATVEYRIVDVYTGRAVDRDAVHVRHEGRRRRGVFPGDYRDLDLSGAELSLFDRDDQQAAERAIENQLIDRLAEELADGTFYHLLRHID